MKKKIKNKIRICGCMVGCFWAMLLVPNLLWLLVSPWMANSNTENRVLAEFPRITADSFYKDLESYPRQIEDYINDHAAFRSQFLSLNAGINLVLFRSVDNPTVIRGRENWYFFNGGASVEDYRGQNLLSETDLITIASKVLEANRHFEELGVEFVILLAPNKERIYSEYMPSCYTRLSDITRYDQLAEGLRELTDVPIVAPKSYYLENRNRLWYFKSDTHWNEAGAFVAGQMLIETLGGNPTALEDLDVCYDYRGPGDIALLFHMPDRFLEDYSCTVNGYYEEVSVIPEMPFSPAPITRTHAENAPDKRHIALFHDSFTLVMMDKFSRYFQQVTYYPWQDFSPEYLTKEELPDVLVYEVVERDIARIVSDMDELMLAGR